MEIKHEAAVAAAEWWAEKVDGHCRHDNGDRSAYSLLAMMLADSLNEPVTTDQLERFKDALVRRIESGEYTIGWYVDLGCDYGPDRILRESADEAGISHNNFPYKTNMWVGENEVKVSDGYGAPAKRVWPEENVADRQYYW